MSISSNSIFHHTRSIENLKKILDSGGFINQYCSEKIYINQRRKIGIDVIMVSFCDIPLVDYKRYYRKEKESKTEFGLGYYGDFGIGLTKKWAVKNKLNPVFYVQKNSVVADIFKPILKKLDSANPGDKFETNDDIIRFCKNYEGKPPKKDARDSTSSTPYRYYNEREWRYVPQKDIIIGGKTFPIVVKDFEINKDQDCRKPEKDDANTILKESPLLKFTCEDITMIIVQKEEQVVIVAKILRKKLEEEMKSKRSSQKSIDEKFYQLTARIVTTNQLTEDF